MCGVEPWNMSVSISVSTSVVCFYGALRYSPCLKFQVWNFDETLRFVATLIVILASTFDPALSDEVDKKKIKGEKSSGVGRGTGNQSMEI